MLCLMYESKSQCNLSTTTITVSNVPNMATFQNLVNTACGATYVTFTSGTYKLQNFAPKLVINGFLNVDVNFTIENSQQILMGSNAFIQVAASCATHPLFYVENSTIKANTANLWQGIFADNQNNSCVGGWTGIKVYNSTIKDANIAIELNNKNSTQIVSCDVFNTTFDKNYIGIEADYSSSTIKSPISVKKSRFTCTSTLLAPFTNQYTTAGIVGLLVNNLTVGDITETNSNNFNVFEGIACGVFSYFCNVNAYASKFNYIQQLSTTLIPISPWQEFYTGVGIYQRGVYYNWIWGTADPTVWDQYASSTLNVNHATANCRFYTCFRGIEAHNTHANINNTVMSNMEYGILTQNCNTATVNIQSNTIDLVKWGMFFSLNYNSNVSVNYANTIGMPSPYGVFGPGYYGIRIVDWPSYNGHYLVQGNNLSGGHIGIRLENANNTSTVQHNTVLQQNVNGSTLNTTNLYGIQAVNCNTSNVIENVVTGYTGTWNTLYRQTGIYLNNSPGTVVRCNQTQTTGYGIWSHGNNTATDKMENNTMTNHYYGLYLSKLSSAYGKVGDQGSGIDFNGNLFNGTYTGTFKSFNLTDVSQNPSTTDLFWYDSPNSAMYTSNFSSSNPTGRPVRVQPILGSYTTPPSCPVYLMMGGGGGGGSTLLNEASIEEDEAVAIAEETKTYTEFSEVSKWLDERKLYDVLDETGSNNTALENFYDDKTSESVGKFKSYNNALEELAQTTNAASYQEKLAVAIQKNNEVPATHIYEQSEKDMNEIFLTNLATNGFDRFDAAQTNRILALAQSCPFADGKAVYLARALYSLIEPNVIFDDAPICESMGYYKKEKENNTIDTRREKYAYISPNPTGTMANLFLNLDEQEGGEIELRDLLGTIVLKQTLVPDKTVQPLNLESIASGTYLYSVITSKGYKNTGKLVVFN